MANLFAVADRDPELVERIEQRLASSGEFDHVWRPAPGWVAAQAPLPESESDGDVVRSRGLAFLEGRDRLQRAGDGGWLDHVVELCDRAPHRLAELPGDFALVRFRDDGTALAVRSCGGLVPLYLHRRDGGGVALGTLLNYFPRLLPEHFCPDRLVNASWDRAPLRLIDGRTFVERVSILPRASHTELQPGQAPRTGIYWDPRPGVGEEPQPSPEHPRELRRLLIELLSRDLDPRGRNLLTLSGGVDSSSLGSLAAGTVGRRLSSWSLIPALEPERSRELSYIDPLVSRFDIEPAHKRELTEENHRRWITTAPGLPFQVLHPALCDLPNVCADHQVRVLVGGEFADEVCGHRKRLTDWALHTSLPSLVRGAPLPFGRRDYLLWGRRRLERLIHRPPLSAMELPAWAPPDVEAEYREWLRRQRAEIARDRRPLAELAYRTSGDAWVAMNWEGTAPLGVRRVLPFFNREVLELAFRCHPSELLGPGPKRLLRDALGTDVPARNLLRSDRGVWRGHFTDGHWRMDGPLPPAAERIVRADWQPVPPPNIPFIDGSLLVHAIRVAEHLERSGATTHDREPLTGP